MTSVRFGDLMVLAREDLAAAGRIEGELRSAAMVAAAHAVGRIARILSSYLADVAPYGVVEAMVNPSLDDRVRAAVDARQALRTAATTLRRSSGPTAVGEAVPDPDLAIPGGGPGRLMAEPDSDPVVAHLRGAGAALAAGRDLLRTHLGTGADGELVDRSEWAAVIRSPPVTRAVLAEAARWSGEVAFLAAKLSLAAPVGAHVPIPVQHGLASACHWLLTASGSLTAVQRADPVSPADVGLLDAIPANHIPARRPPAKGEPVVVLAQGVADSEARLVAVTRAAPGRAVWSPAMTADSWRWTAGAATAICHMSEQALRILASHPELGAALPAAAPPLAEAAENIGRAWERWRNVGRAWRSITTEAKGLTGPGLADTSDLALRLGRIIFCDPAWTPERRDSAALPSAAGLAPDLGGFAAIIGAVHHAIDALGHIGAADGEAVGLAIRAAGCTCPPGPSRIGMTFLAGSGPRRLPRPPPYATPTRTPATRPSPRSPPWTRLPWRPTSQAACWPMPVLPHVRLRSRRAFRRRRRRWMEQEHPCPAARWRPAWISHAARSNKQCVSFTLQTRRSSCAPRPSTKPPRR